MQATSVGGYVHFADEKSLYYLSESVRGKACILVGSSILGKVKNSKERRRVEGSIYIGKCSQCQDTKQ